MQLWLNREEEKDLLHYLLQQTCDSINIIVGLCHLAHSVCAHHCGDTKQRENNRERNRMKTSRKNVEENKTICKLQEHLLWPSTVNQATWQVAHTQPALRNAQTHEGCDCCVICRLQQLHQLFYGRESKLTRRELFSMVHTALGATHLIDSRAEIDNMLNRDIECIMVSLCNTASIKSSSLKMGFFVLFFRN